jgi:hypothetical protein
MPWAALVSERFHVARASRDCADTVRQQARQRLTRARPTAQYAESNGAMGPFRQRSGELEAQEWDLLERRLTASPQREAAEHLRDALTDLVEQDAPTAGATCALRAWCTRGRPRGRAACERVLGTLERGLDEITHACQGRPTRGVGGGLQHPREGAHAARRGNLHRRQALPTAHARLAGIPTLRSSLTSQPLVANHGNSGRARIMIPAWRFNYNCSTTRYATKAPMRLASRRC